MSDLRYIICDYQNHKHLAYSTRCFERKFDVCCRRRKGCGSYKKIAQFVAEKRLEILEKVWTEIKPESRIKELARTFPKHHGLKAADSLQLAAALVWYKEIPKNKDFVSGDAKLLKVAEDVGFTIHHL